MKPTLCWFGIFIRRNYFVGSCAFKVVWMNSVALYSNVTWLKIAVFPCQVANSPFQITDAMMKCGDCRSLMPWKLTMFLELSSENACLLTWCIIILEVLIHVWINCSFRCTYSSQNFFTENKNINVTLPPLPCTQNGNAPVLIKKHFHSSTIPFFILLRSLEMFLLAVWHDQNPAWD